MEWTISPYVGVGPLKIGMTRAEAQQVLSGEKLATKKNPNKGDHDYYPKIAVFLNYDSDGRLELIEIFTPCEVLYDGVSFLHTDFTLVKEKLNQKYGPVREGVGSFDFPQLGIAFYVPHSGPANTVAIFERGYYEKHGITRTEVKL
jgi:hypothetical protein